MLTAAELLDRFSDHLKLLNRSPLTIKAYREHLNLFVASIEVYDLRMVSKAMIESWLVDLYDHRTATGKPYQTNTLCLKIRAVKRFFEFLESTNCIFINPTASIKEPKLDRRLPKQICSADEIRKLLNQPDLATRIGLRDRAIMELFYSTGIRKAELCSLELHNADIAGKAIWVKGKGGKDRVVPMGTHAAGFLREYLAKGRPLLMKKGQFSNHLFLDIHGNPINKQSVSARIRKYARDAGIQKHVGSHMFRHVFATGLIKNGAEITAVRKMLGHACLETTEVYIRSLGLDLKESHTKTHPREQDTVDDQEVKPDIERMIPHGHLHGH